MDPAAQACEKIEGPCISFFGSKTTLHNMPVQSIPEIWWTVSAWMVLLSVLFILLILGLRAYTAWQQS